MQKWLANRPIVAKTCLPVGILLVAQGAAVWSCPAVSVQAICAAVFLIGLGLLFWLVKADVANPLKDLGTAMGRLVSNDLAVTIGHVERDDEIGRIAHYVEVVKSNALQRRRLEEAGAAEAGRREEGQRKVAVLTGQFDKAVTGALEVVSSAAAEMEATAQAMSANAQHTNSQAMMVATSSEDVSASVETAATAAEELSKSIAEIGRQVNLSTRVSQSASEEAIRTRATVNELAESSARISDVVNLINGIANQTNLLALNATIEAARAGEAGKGFAVVATEVKNLANQSEKATGEISAQIAAVQAASKDAVAAIGAIAGRIDEIHEIAAAIASAVDEQSAATSEIARNVQQAAAVTRKVSSIIGTVTQAAGETGGAASQVLTSAQSLAREATSLKTIVGNFLGEVFGAAKEKGRTFRYADNQPADYPTVRAAEQVGKILSQKTGGDYALEVFANSALGSESYTVEQVQMGSLDMVRVSSGMFHDTVPETMILSLPFLYRDDEHLRKVIYGPIGERVLAKLDTVGLAGLAIWEAGSRSIYAKKPVRKPADCKGMKIRVINSALWTEFAKAVGAVPTPLPSTEVYNALKSGGVDAAENNYPTYQTGKHFEAAPCFSETRHVRCPEILAFSKKIWGTLSDAERQHLRNAAKEATPYYSKLWSDKERASKDLLVKAGVKFITDVDQAAFVKTMKPVWDRFTATNDLRTLLNDILNTR
jgi:methyl-accepting chemotaxis protein